MENMQFSHSRRFYRRGIFFRKRIIQSIKNTDRFNKHFLGGTHVETWTSHEAFESSNEFKSMIAEMPLLNLDSLSKLRKAASLKK